MRLVGVSAHFEPALRKTFGSLGAFTSRAPLLCVTATVMFLVLLSGGNWMVDYEKSVNELLIARRGRIDGERDFFEDNFELISPVLQSVIVTPKPGVDLFAASTLDEVYALHESIRTYTMQYKGLNVSLEQFCFKAINADPTEPCWQSSLLESFREGAVFNVGGELNTDYAVLFAPRPSYREFDFENDFTRSFLAQTNLNPDSLLLGGFEVDPKDQDTITSVSALQLAFGAKSPDGLRNDGLQYFEWSERPAADPTNGICPDASTCEPCADAIQATMFLAAGCTVDGAPTQSDECCAILDQLRTSPCVEVIFERRPEVGPVVNPLLAVCGLPVVEISPRCNNQPLFVAEVAPAAGTVPAVCTCLAGDTPECGAAAGPFVTENPEYSEVFASAISGEEEAVAELGRVLIEEIGCPLEAAVNPICSCLTDNTGEACTTALGTFLEENPEQAALFGNAAGGDPEAQAEVGAFLVTEFGCELPSEDPDADTQQQTAAAAGATVSYEATVTVIHEHTDSIDKARNLMHAWEKAWRDAMNDIVAEYQYIDVVWISSSSVDDEVEEAGRAEFGLFVLGYGLVVLYILFFVTFDWKLGGARLAYYPPGPGISVLCFMIVSLSVAAAVGAAGYMSQWTSIKMSFGSVQMVPLLMLGLGVNDFFVLVQALKGVLYNPNCPKTVANIMYEAMAVGGTSITLSSVANAVAFALGSLSSVPSVLWFSLQMSVGVVIAYIVSLFAIPAMLSVAVRLHLAGKPDFLLALVRLRPQPPPTSGEDARQSVNEGVVAAGIRRFRWPLVSIVFAVFAVWVAMGVRTMVSFEQGVDLSEAVQDGGHSKGFLVASERYFDTSQFNIVFRDTVDYADPDDFQSVRQSEFEYVNEGYRTEKQLMSQSWMEFYTQYVEAKFCSNEICMDEVVWYYDGFSSPEFRHPAKNVCAGVETPEECEVVCQTHCPQGPLDSDFRCQYQEGTTECYCPYRPMLQSQYFFQNPRGFDSKIQSYWSDFLVNTTTGRASRLFVNLDDTTATRRNPMGMPQASRAYVFARGLSDVPREINHIEKGRDILDRQEVDVYPFDYLVYAISEQYIDLGIKTVEAVAICMAVAAVVMLPLIINIFTSLIVCGCVLLAVLLTAGTSSWTVLNLDYSCYTAFIATVGLSLEFCVHVARAFMLATGDRLTRTLFALRTMGIAVLNGGLTTFLGILPSAFSSYPAVEDRLFVQFSIIVLAGTSIGLVFHPTILSLIGPPSINKVEDQENQINSTQAEKEQKESAEP